MEEINLNTISNIKLLSICCTFRRPDMFKNMMGSFYKNKSDGTELIIYLHEDDPKLEEYKKIVSGHNYIIGRHRYLQEVINYITFNICPEIPYYQIICDDHIYHTTGWDSLLINALESKANGWGYACGRDGSNNDNWQICQHPSAEIWTWKFCNAIGYVYPKTFKHTGMDYFTKDISKAINGLVFVPEVRIEHLWYGGCNKPKDINLQEKYNNKEFEEGYGIYHEWIKNERQNIINKINDAKAKEHT